MFYYAAKKSIFTNLKFVVGVLSYLGWKLWNIQTKQNAFGDSVKCTCLFAKKLNY